MRTLLTITLLSSCGVFEPDVQHKYTEVKVNRPETIITEKGDKGDPGERGPQGEQGQPGVDGATTQIMQQIVCTDDVPSFAGAKFIYEISIFSSGDNFASVVLFDDDGELASNAGWGVEGNYTVSVYYDKQKNDDWGQFKFYLDIDTLMYQVQYLDNVDGNENYLVPNKCTVN